ncbi:imidazoleglycerol-phosphate dehydratase [Candidatus Acetothermia bacterium]|nr:imidazoleglycerol-phosphate dehydratase [Candidatus Acetothermia bacterium]MBI3659696.1 imidazoleglycerol-phosphate dehydratase [Candidatus Acetothermia bacterium]
MAKNDRVQVQRRTRETEIDLKLRLNGSGQVKLSVEPYFLRHMLESFALHGGFHLDVKAQGEDEHHLIEDVGISLGQAIRQAIPTLKIERISHAIVAMDDALVLVALDLVDRPFAQIELPIAIYAHFLRSMALEGKFTLHVRPLAGLDSHHVVEAAFKGLGRALRQAVRPVARVSSTKGEVEWR